MNATASMLEAPLEKTAFAPDIGEAIMRAYKQFGTKGLAGFIPGVDSYAASGLAGVGASELTSRLMPQIARRNPKKVKALQAIASGLAGGGTGLASSFIGAPLMRDLKKVPNTKLLPELASLGALAGGAELLAAPYMGKTTGALEPILTTGAGAGLVSAAQGIRKKINLDNFIRAARRAGKEVDAKPISYTKSIMDSFRKLPGGSLPAGAGAALLATGSPVLGGTALLSAPLMNNKVTEYLADVSKELQRNKEIKELYKKSSLNAPLATELSKLAAPAYMTLSPNSLEAYTMDKQAFIGALGEFLGKGIQKFTGGMLGKGVQAGRTVQRGVRHLPSHLEGLQTFGREQILKGMGHTPTAPATRKPGFLTNFMEGISKGRNQQFEAQTGLSNVTRQERKFLTSAKGGDKSQAAFREVNPVLNNANPEIQAARRGAETQQRVRSEIGMIPTTESAVAREYVATTGSRAGQPLRPVVYSGGSPVIVKDTRMGRVYNRQFATAEAEVNALRGQLSAAPADAKPFIQQRLQAAEQNLNKARTQHEEAFGQAYASHPRVAPTAAPTVATDASRTTRQINIDLGKQRRNINAEIKAEEEALAKSTDPLRKQILQKRLEGQYAKRQQIDDQITQFRSEAIARNAPTTPAPQVQTISNEIAMGRGTVPELQTRASEIDTRLQYFNSEVSRINSTGQLTKAQKEQAIARLQPEIQKLTAEQSKAYEGLYKGQYGRGVPNASSVTESAKAQQFTTDLDNAIGQINTQISTGGLTPVQEQALNRRLRDLTSQRNQMSDRVIATADTAALNTQKTKLTTEVQQQEAIINDLSGTYTRDQINAAKAQKARLEGELGKVTNREQQLASEAEAATLQAQRQQAEITAQQSQTRAQNIKSKMTAPTREQSQQVQDIARTELGATGASAEFRVKGLSDSTNNYVYEQGLIPREYAQFEKGTLRLSRTGASEAARSSGLNEAVTQADKALKEHLYSQGSGLFSQRMEAIDSPVSKLINENPNLRNELTTRANSFIKNPKMTQEELANQLRNEMRIDPAAADEFAASLANSGAIQQTRRNLEVSSSNFQREMNSFMSKEFRASSDKVITDIGKDFNKVKGLTEQETSQFQGIVTALQESGLSSTAEGNAILSYLKDSMKSGDMTRTAISDVTKLIRGETATISTSGTKKFLGRNTSGRMGSISLKPNQIERLKQTGLEVGQTTRGDLSQFGASNLRNLETHFGDKAVAQELQQLSVSSNEGASAVNKVMSGNASLADFSAKELNALNITPYKPSAGVTLPRGYTNKSPGDVVRQATKEITAQEKIIKRLESKPNLNKSQKKQLNAAKQEVKDLQALQTDAQTYITNNQSTLDRFTNEVRNARVQYEAQGGVEGTLNFTGETSRVFEQQPGLFSRFGSGADNILRGSQYAGEKGPGALGLGFTGAGVLGATAYGASPSQSSYMLGTASFGLGPLAPPVRYIKKTAMMAPVKFKGNTTPKMLGAPVVESPMTSTHIHKYMQAPVG